MGLECFDYLLIFFVLIVKLLFFLSFFY